MEESSIGVNSAPPDTGTSTAVDSPSTQGTSTAPSNEQSGSSVKAADVQDKSSSAESDPLDGLPTLEQLQAEAENGTPYAKGLAQLRSAYDPLKTQFGELQQKFSVFEPVADRFEKPEQLQELIQFSDSLFGYARDEQNQLVPSTDVFAQNLAQRDPLVADFLAADLMNGTTRTEDGREISRISYALEEMARDPNRRAEALKILGGVEPTSIAPTWQPTPEELEVVTPELRDIYSKLPYDKRESLKLNDPAFINDYLGEQKFKQELIAQNQQAQQIEQQRQQRQIQWEKQQTESAGNQSVEQGFRQGWTEFATSTIERTQFIQPLDPTSEVARNMPPEQVQQFNQKAQQVNEGVGRFIAVVTAAMAVPDTQWLAVDFIKALGVDESVIQKFNNARLEYANNQRNYGELNFQHSAGQNGNGRPVPAGLGTVQSNANRAMRDLKGYGNAIAQPLQKLLSDFFEMKAGNYNTNLNGSNGARPQANGSRFDPTTAPANQPQGFMTKAELDRMYG